MTSSLPGEFETLMRARLGSAYNNFAVALASPAPVSIRKHPIKPSGVSGFAVPWSRFGIYLHERPVFTLDPLFHGGAYYVQEASSMFLEQAITQTCDLSRPLRVLDLCAAPGGKSTHLLSLLSPESLIVSNEVIRGRTGMLTENIQKWGYDNVIVTQSDPSAFRQLPTYFDLIVIDAPCSGEGLFRREPEAMKQWSSKGVELCAARQRRILNDIIPSLRPGGLVVYSTCTYNENENGKNVEWLLSHQNLESVSLNIDPAWNIQHVGKSGCHAYQLYPHLLKGEGFFLSVLRKPGGFEEQTKAVNTLKYPSAPEVDKLSQWIHDASEKVFFLHGQVIRFMPHAMRDDLCRLLHSVNVLAAGSAVGEYAHGKFIPDHELALSLARNKDQFPALHLDKKEALNYLRKGALPLRDAPRGFAIVEFEGLSLGWVNILPNRINNLYPQARRIRMAS